MENTLFIIVSYNCLQCLKSCVDSILHYFDSPDILIIDNGSISEVRQFLQHNSSIKYIQTGSNLGFGRANNIGMRYALDEGYEYVMLLNQDTIIIDGGIKSMIRLADQRKEFGILSPIHLAEQGDKLDPSFCKNYLSQILPDWFKDVKTSHE